MCRLSTLRWNDMFFGLFWPYRATRITAHDFETGGDSSIGLNKQSSSATSFWLVAASLGFPGEAFEGEILLILNGPFPVKYRWTDVKCLWHKWRFLVGKIIKLKASGLVPWTSPTSSYRNESESSSSACP